MTIKLGKIDKLWEIISILLTLLNALLLACTIPILPDVIPIHFDGKGNIDSYGSKYIIWAVLGTACFMYAIMTLVSLDPGYNGTQLSDISFKERYRIISKMTRILKTFISLFFLVLTFFILQTVQGKWIEYLSYLAIALLFSILLPILYFIVKIFKVK